MTKPENNIQDAYLFQVLKAGQPLTIELVNGRRIEGVLKSFDRFALIVEHSGREKLVYKHGIATVESSAF